jgi:hypothetical protein
VPSSTNVARVVVGLVVLDDDDLPGGRHGPNGGAEAPDAEVPSHRRERAAPVVDLLDLVDVGDTEVRHTPLLSRMVDGMQLKQRSHARLGPAQKRASDRHTRVPSGSAK